MDSKVQRIPIGVDILAGALFPGPRPAPAEATLPSSRTGHDLHVLVTGLPYSTGQHALGLGGRPQLSASLLLDTWSNLLEILNKKM